MAAAGPQDGRKGLSPQVSKEKEIDLGTNQESEFTETSYITQKHKIIYWVPWDCGL